jgi:hypothetical protein
MVNTGIQVVKVFNQAPGGGTSNTMIFTITAGIGDGNTGGGGTPDPSATPEMDSLLLFGGGLSGLGGYALMRIRSRRWRTR